MDTSEFKLGLPFAVLDLVYKFQMIFLSMVQHTTIKCIFESQRVSDFSLYFVYLHKENDHRNIGESDVKHPYTISTDCLCCYGYSVWKTMDLMPDLVKPKNIQFAFLLLC
jgi:hypothetical protein